ncbi:MAG: efflux RND transporter permease subunit [Myxococcales bacterium]
MNLSAIAIRRPVFTVMVILGLMVLGVMGFSRLGTDLFPDVSFPIVVVTVPYPGASPNEVEQLVAKPLEDSIISLNGLDRLRSSSREGSGVVIAIFKLGIDPKQAAVEVRERVAQTRYKLPQEIKEPIVSRFDVSAAPILTYTLRGEGKSLSETQKFAKDVIKPVLEQVDGVASVDVRGGADREIHVDLDLGRIDALRLSPLAILGELKQQNLTVPAGHFEEGTREIAVRTVGEFSSVDDIRNLVVATAADGSGVRLRDLATVEDGFEELRTKVRTNGERAVSFDVVKQSGSNTVAVADAVKAKLAEVSRTFPTGFDVNLIIDQSTFIKQDAHEVEVSIVFGGVMAILVILVFMLDLRSTLISAVALPTSVVATFFFMYVLDFTLNMMTLLGLSLSIGLLIDDAVVVRENISKHLERGEEPRAAALNGTKEIALSVMATTLTVVAVFVPVAFMKGIVGQFFRQFGLTITGAVLVSLFVAFTLDPMLSSRFSKAHREGAIDPFALVKRPFQWVFAGIDALYRSVLTWAVNHRWIVGVLALASLVGMAQMAGLMGLEFMSTEDRGQFVVELELPPGTSLAETERLSLGAERKLLETKGIITVLAILGQDGMTNKVKWRVVATTKSMREATLEELKAAATKAGATIPGTKVAVNDPPFIEGAATEAPIMVLVRASTYGELEPLTRKFEAAMTAIPGISGVQVKFSPGQPEVRVKLDRERAATAHLSVAQLALSLRAAMNGEEASKLRQGKDEVPIRVRLGQDDRSDVGDVLRMSIWTPVGQLALGDIAKVERGEGPSVIEREGRERQITIWAVPNGRSLGELVTDMKAAFAKIEMPPGSRYYFDGQIRQMNESNEAMLLALALGVVFIYIVLASQFESFIHPLTIMLTLPLALVGAILALFLAQATLAMGAMIGIILLMGLVTKNAILLLDRAIVRVRDQGETPRQAILEAGPERLRPILMTSAAMILGMLPTAIGTGEGSEFRAPMAIAVIGGVVSSTLLSLVVVPAFYLGIEDFKGWLARGLGQKVRERVIPDGAPAE